MGLDSTGSVRSIISLGGEVPKGPCRTKILRVVNLLGVVDCDRIVVYYSGAPCADTVSWELQTLVPSKRGSRRSKFGGRSKNVTA